MRGAFAPHPTKDTTMPSWLTHLSDARAAVPESKSAGTQLMMLSSLGDAS